jgi:hypothetical protein
MDYREIASNNLQKIYRKEMPKALEKIRAYEHYYFHPPIGSFILTRVENEDYYVVDLKLEHKSYVSAGPSVLFSDNFSNFLTAHYTDAYLAGFENYLAYRENLTDVSEGLHLWVQNFIDRAIYNHELNIRKIEGGELDKLRRELSIAENKLKANFIS